MEQECLVYFRFMIQYGIFICYMFVLLVQGSTSQLLTIGIDFRGRALGKFVYFMSNENGHSFE